METYQKIYYKDNMKDALEIIPLLGLGSIKFGMNPKEVMNLMDEEQIYEEWMGGNLNDSLLYHGIIFSFDTCNSHGPLKDSKLNYIRIFNRENTLLFSKLTREWTEGNLLEYAKTQNSHYKTYPNGNIEFSDLMLEVYFEEEINSFWVDFYSPNDKISSSPSIFSKLSNLFK